MTAEKNPYEPDAHADDATQALTPIDATVELPVTARETAGTADALPADSDATQVVDTGTDDGLADELFRAGETQVLPVSEPTLAEPTLALPVTPALPADAPAATHTQAYPVQDAPVDPEPVVAPPSPAPAVDPAAQWNATAQQTAQASPAAVPGQDPRNHGLRVGTVVWGFIIVAVGAGILALALGARYDLDLALIGLLSVAGLVLVVGSIVSSSRRTARERARR